MDKVGQGIVLIRKGPWQNDLFDIKCPECLKHWCCYWCTLAEIHQKTVGEEKIKAPVAGALACCCAGCQLVIYGRKQRAPLEVLPVSIFKACCCGACYLHQQYKEVNSALGQAASAAGGAATAVNNFLGKPSQEEMS